MNEDDVYLPDPLLATGHFLLKRIDKGLSCTTIITGEPGTGKSTLAINLGMACGWLQNKAWNWKTGVTYAGDDYLSAIESLPRGTTVIMNEGGENLHSHTWYDQVNKAIIKSQMTDRIFKKNKILIIPFNKQMNSSAKAGCCCRIHCYIANGRRYANILWATTQTSPFNKYADPFYAPLYMRYAFPKLPAKIERSYVKFDMDAKKVLNKKYVDKILKDESWYGDLVKEVKELSSKNGWSSRDDVYTHYKRKGAKVTFSDANKIWKKAKV